MANARDSRGSSYYSNMSRLRVPWEGLMATPSLLNRVIESQGQDAELVSIRDRVQSGTSDEDWAIHTNGSLWYRGWVVVSQSMKLREEILKGVPLLSIHCASWWHEDVS